MLLRKHRYRLEDNIKIYLKVVRCGMDCAGSG